MAKPKIYKPKLNRKKFNNLVAYIAREANTDDLLKINFLIYKIDFGFYAETGRSITGATYRKLKIKIGKRGRPRMVIAACDNVGKALLFDTF